MRKGRGRNDAFSPLFSLLFFFFFFFPPNAPLRCLSLSLGMNRAFARRGGNNELQLVVLSRNPKQDSGFPNRETHIFFLGRSGFISNTI
jgi:hypothetical protein